MCYFVGISKTAVSLRTVPLDLWSSLQRKSLTMIPMFARLKIEQLGLHLAATRGSLLDSPVDLPKIKWVAFLSSRTGRSRMGWRSVNGRQLMALVLVLGGINLSQSLAMARQDPTTLDELPTPVSRPVSFETEIAPLLESRCVSCHGPAKQKSGLRLDNEKDAMAGGDLGSAIEPGASAESYLIHKVTGFDGESIMPPNGDPLTDQEVGLLRAWIDQGAHWGSTPEDQESGTAITSDHWSFQPIQRFEPPTVHRSDWVIHPIDQFVLRRLESEAIAPSEEADRATLIRRLSLDLTGLPPKPDDVDAFINDQAPDAYEQLVDRLLASPRFGERWGRHWLDLARYADSDGFEKDRPRPFAYRYRDWVIDAINRDLPYDDFTIEQLAGDLLPDPTLDQKTATGFHRNTLTNTEGGVDQEEYRVAAVIDRVNTTGTTWLGLTVACAQCHTHKYDPILQREYYQLFAFFNTANETNLNAPTPEERAAFDRAKEAFHAEEAELKGAIDSYLRDELPAQQQRWEELSTSQPATSWTPLQILETSAELGTSLRQLDDGSFLAEGARPATETYKIVGETELTGITAIRLEVLPDERFPENGPGRADNGNFVLSEFRVEASPRYEGEQSRKVGLAHPSTDFEQNDWPVASAIDDDPKTGWAVSPQFGTAHKAVFETDLSIGTDCGTRFKIELDQQYGRQHTIGRFRLSVTNSPTPISATPIPEDVAEALALAPEARSEADQRRINIYYESIDLGLAKLKAALVAHQKEVPKLSGAKIRTFVEQKPEDRRVTKMLIRGSFLRPGEPVQADTLGVLQPLKRTEEKEEPDRLDLANWLVEPKNPLTARVAVNRIWYYLFGQAIVPTMDDFGTRGDPPSHPELLDWLASEYQRVGWSRKELIRAIVTSATYRQSSATREHLMDLDPSNTLLARQNRFRLEAESVRDVALAASGLFTDRVGGPSVYPPQPEGIEALTYAGNGRWPVSTGPDRYRRGLYTFFRRTSPYPMLTTFDAPDANICAVGRNASNTPLQALTLLNDEVFVECARALGLAALTESSEDDLEGRLTLVFRCALGRPPEPAEIEILESLYYRLLQGFAASAVDAEALSAKADVPEGSTQAEVAAMIGTARTILNLDEFITRE